MASEPTLHLDGMAYPLVMPDDMTIGEQRAFERIADAGIDKLDGLDTDYRAGLVAAWMAVSIHRAAPGRSIGQIMGRIDELKSDELRQVWDDVAGQSPPPTDANPTEPSVSETNSADSSNAGSEPTRGNSNQNGSGDHGAATGSASDPETLVVSPPTS